MIFINKNVGETPLEVIERVRRERPELATEKLSYAGRLDPMAEGEMLILVGEENKEREKFLGLDKEYIATFLVGVKTDTGDALGLIEENQQGGVENSFGQYQIDKIDLENSVEKLTNIKEQKYPWFSGQTVDGVKLFDHFKAGRTDTDLERPTLDVKIKEAELVDLSEEKTEKIRQHIFDSIAKVRGDFRQKEILSKWSEFFDSGFGSTVPKMQTFEVRFLVSSGTYIRALTENFGFPVTLLKLKRTQIIRKLSSESTLSNMSGLSQNENKIPWWRDGLVFFAKVSVWIAAPVIIFLFIGQYAENKWGTPPWMFFGLIMIAFIFSCVGIVKEGIAYINKVSGKPGEKIKKEDGTNTRK